MVPGEPTAPHMEAPITQRNRGAGRSASLMDTPVLGTSVEVGYETGKNLRGFYYVCVTGTVHTHQAPPST